MGMTALRENARLKIERLAFVGRGAAAAVGRRLRAETLHAARASASVGQTLAFRRRR